MDRTKITRATNEVKKYLEHDCKGLYESIKKFKEWPLIKEVGMKSTVASQSIQILKSICLVRFPLCQQVWTEPRFTRQRARTAWANLLSRLASLRCAMRSIRRKLLAGAQPGVCQRERVLHLHHTPHGEEYVDIELIPLRNAHGEISWFVERMTPLPSARRHGNDDLIGRATTPVSFAERGLL